MSVIETNKIDGIGISKDGRKLVLLITDHLDWNHEYEHLIQLQNKLNSNIAFLESQQYKEVYPNSTFSSYLIEIRFMYELTANCEKFVDVIKKQIEEQNIFIEVIVDKSGNT